MAIEDKRKWWVLAAMTFATSMIFIDVTVLPVALPTIQRELNLSDLALQWLINSYLLALTVLLLAGGKLGDMYGQRKVFSSGLIVFVAASALCGFSHSDAWFIASRVLQGIGGAFMLPAIGATIVAVFPPQQRGKAMGINVSAGSIFLAIGPFVGGVLTQYLSWRYVFWINIPIGAVGLVLSLLFVPQSHPHRSKFDVTGFLTLCLGISAVVVAFMQTSTWGWGSPFTWGLFLLGIVLIGALVVIDRNIEHPFVDFSLFRKKSFSGALACLFCVGSLLMVTVFWVIFFQDILGYSPSAAGGIAFLSNAPVILMAPVAGHLTDRFGPKFPSILGFGLILGGLIGFLLAVTSNNLFVLIPCLIVFGCGVPLVFNPCFISPLSEVDPKKRGMASGILTTLRQLSASVGMAVIGSIFLYRQSALLGRELVQNPKTAHLDPEQFEGLLSSSPSALAALDHLTTETALYVKEAVLETYVSAFLDINAIAAFTALAGLFLAYALLKKGSIQHHK